MKGFLGLCLVEVGGMNSSQLAGIHHETPSRLRARSFKCLRRASRISYKSPTSVLNGSSVGVHTTLIN